VRQLCRALIYSTKSHVKMQFTVYRVNQGARLTCSTSGIGPITGITDVPGESTGARLTKHSSFTERLLLRDLTRLLLYKILAQPQKLDMNLPWRSR
jgi:hypothetical protein